MATANIVFTKLIQNFHDQNAKSPNDDRMRSVIEFTAEIGGKMYHDLRVELSQPAGTNYASEPIEVGQVQGYQGPWDHAAFSEHCEGYYRRFCGQGGLLSFGGGGKVVMRNNRTIVEHRFSIQIPDGASPAW